MAKVTDETLMFYADGVLASPEKEHVAKRVAEDGELRSRLQVFERTGRELADLLQDHVDAPVPDRLRDPLLQPAHPQPGLAGKYSRFPQLPEFAMEKLRAVEIWHPRVAIAAVMALVVGVGLGWGLRGNVGGSAVAMEEFIQLQGKKLIAQGQLQHTLENAQSRKNSGSTASNNETLDINTRMTFRNAAGNYCRQYEITGPAINRYVGIACRSEDEWQVQMQAIAPPPNTGPGRIVPATGGASVAIDAATGALVFGAPLTRQEEAAVIRDSWKIENGTN